MEKEIIFSKRSSKISNLPYSPAVKVGNMVFVSGQVGDDPDSDITTQTRQALEKTKSLLEEAGSSLENVVKCTVFLSNINDYHSMNIVYSEYFSENPPARSCVEVGRLVRNLKVEIEAIAFL